MNEMGWQSNKTTAPHPDWRVPAKSVMRFATFLDEGCADLMRFRYELSVSRPSGSLATPLKGPEEDLRSMNCPFSSFRFCQSPLGC
jgi:hypothetical protein